MTMAIAYEGKNPNVDIHYTMIPMTNGEYQTKLKAALGTADAPDVIALEAAFVKEFVESDFLADLGDLTARMRKRPRPTPSSLMSAATMASSKPIAYQATPGALFYRRSLAKEYFGTDDPAEIQALLSDFDKFTAAAAVVKEKSGGDTYMVASSGDFQNPFFANRDQPWIVDDTLVVDPMVQEYVDTAKLFRDEGYEAQATQWQEGWFAGMNDSLVDAEGNPKTGLQLLPAHLGSALRACSQCHVGRWHQRHQRRLGRDHRSAALSVGRHLAGRPEGQPQHGTGQRFHSLCDLGSKKT